MDRGHPGSAHSEPSKPCVEFVHDHSRIPSIHDGTVSTRPIGCGFSAWFGTFLS